MILRRVAADLDATFVDITDVTSRAVGSSELIAVDGVHFSSAMHERWVDLMVDALSQDIAS